jgi:molybdate transport system ATP-binding protein
MTLAVDVTHRLGQFTLQARFASKGKLTAFFGPSGSGKTSLLNMIAGILRPDQGSIVLNDRILVDTAKGIVVPMHRSSFRI